MEVAGDIAYVCMWGILGVVSFTFRETDANLFFNVAFGLAAALAWLCLVVTRDTHTQQ